MAVTSMDGYVTALQSGVAVPLYKQAFTPQAIGGYTSLWQIAGIPGAGAAPSSAISGDVPTMATAGAIPFTNPVAPALSYLARVAIYGTLAGTLMIYDRLVQTGSSSGISSTSTGAQTINTTAITRPDANGAGVEAWWQVYATMGSGTPTVTLAYTDQDGNASQAASSGALVTTMAQGRTGPFTLAAGDTGVRSVQTWTASATFTSGTIGLVLRRFIAMFPITTANVSVMTDLESLGLPRIYDSACLEFIWLPGSASATTVGGQVQIAQG